MLEKENVFVGISGGVDSAAAVLILKEEGYNVIGVYLDMFGAQNDEVEQLKKQLEIDIICEDVSKRFNRDIVNSFIDDYVSGKTPSPCSVCNPLIKWRMLIEIADREGGKSAKVATGHYVRIVERNAKLYIARGRDELKNQSYYLWRLSQAVLKRAVFPLGESIKSEVKEMMSSRGYESIAKKRESMGVCFLKGCSYQDFLIEKRPELSKLNKGEIVSSNGDVIGYHKGYPFYTLAQKKGLPIDKNSCIVSIDKDTNRIYIGTPSDLKTKILWIEDFLITDETEFFTSNVLKVNVRGIGVNPQGYCHVEKSSQGRLKVQLLDDDAWAITSGQPIVFYIDDFVVGGGVII